MGSNIEITEKLEEYIENFSHSLHPVQKEIIQYNKGLGDIKRMQISVSQCYFLELIIRFSFCFHLLFCHSIVSSRNATLTSSSERKKEGPWRWCTSKAIHTLFK